MFGGTDPRDMARYVALGQVGGEMVFPIVIGLVIDHYLETSPWGAVVGAMLGLGGGLFHLVYLVNKINSSDSSKR